jgi:hypothetical protein
MTAESYCSREKFAGLKQDPAETSHEMKSGMGAQAQDLYMENRYFGLFTFNNALQKSQ